MRSKIREILGKLIDNSPYEQLKVLFLGISFFFVIGAYTLAKELSGSIFISVVGKEYVFWAKFLTMIVLIPAIFLYAKIVDRVRRYQLLVAYSLLFGLGGLVFTYLIGHPGVGISNTNTSPYRLFGWAFYFFVEGFSPFVVNVFWAFANSIMSPDGAKKNYGIIVSASKIGGMVTAGLAWLLLTFNNKGYLHISDVALHQFFLLVASIFLLCIPIIIGFLMKKVPGKYLHGYEAVYQVEKQKEKTGKSETGVFAGLVLLFKYPYVLGIFGMIYFYELVAAVLSVLRLGAAEAGALNIGDKTAYLFLTMFLTHVMGFFISLLGTRTLLRLLGERICLLLIPLISGIFLLYMIVNPTQFAFGLAFIGLKAINLAFSWPVRESLYIPTIKEIKFKSKSWIDAFGSKFAKLNGNGVILLVSMAGAEVMIPLYCIFFGGVITLWFGTAFLLGKRFDWAVTHNEVIGYQENN